MQLIIALLLFIINYHNYMQCSFQCPLLWHLESYLSRMLCRVVLKTVPSTVERNHGNKRQEKGWLMTWTGHTYSSTYWGAARLSAFIE